MASSARFTECGGFIQTGVANSVLANPDALMFLYSECRCETVRRKAIFRDSLSLRRQILLSRRSQIECRSDDGDRQFH